MECFNYLRNIQDLLSDGKTSYEIRVGQPFKGPITPFGSSVEYHPITAKDQSRIHQFWKESLIWVVPRIRIVRGWNLEGWRTGRRHWESWKRWTHQKSTHKRLNAKQNFPKKIENFTFQTQVKRIKLPGGIKELRTSTLVRHRPIQGESNIDFLGESERLLPPPQESLPDAGESKQWLLVHVKRTSYTAITQSQTSLAERWIIQQSTETHWRIRNYSYELGCQARTPHRWLLGYRWIKRFVWFLDKFHPIDSIQWETSRRTYVVQEESDKTACNIQARSSVARALDKLEREAKLREKQKCSIQKLKLDNAKRLREIYFIDPEDTRFKETMKNARKNLETPMAPAMPCNTCKKSKNGEIRNKANGFQV